MIDDVRLSNNESLPSCTASPSLSFKSSSDAGITSSVDIVVLV